MAYGYSEFTKFTLDVYTGPSKDVQLPPVKMTYDDISATAQPGIYIHTLAEANAFSALQSTDLSSDLSSDTSAVINGWRYSYNFTENDFLRKALDTVSAMAPIADTPVPYCVTKVFTTLHDKQINLPSIFNMYVKNIAQPWHLNGMTWTQSPTWACHDIPHTWHQAVVNDGHTLVYKQTIPGLIFEFDRNDKFIAIIAQPLETTQNDLRTSYVDRLFDFIASTTDFSNFKRFIDEDTEKFVDRPCTLVYDNVVDVKQYIAKAKTCSASAAVPPNDIRNKDALLIEYMNSPWVTFDLTTAIGGVHQFFNVDQLTTTHVQHDPRYNLQTIYATTVANAFNIPLDTYKAIIDEGDSVLVVPEQLFSELKENIISMWLGVNAL